MEMPYDHTSDFGSNEGVNVASDEPSTRKSAAQVKSKARLGDVF